MDEELEQEVPEFTDEEIAETKKDPFSEFFDEEYPAGDDLTYEDTVKSEVLEEMEQQPGEEVPGSDLESDELPETELITSVSVDVDTFNQKLDELNLSICSCILFAAFMICGCMAAIKMIGGKFN